MNENGLAYASASFALGIFFAGLMDWPLAVYYTLLGIVGIAAVAAVLAKRSIQLLLPCVIGLFFVTGAIRLCHADLIPASDISRFAGKTVTVSATIVDGPVISALEGDTQRRRYTAAVSQVLGKQGVWQPVSGKLIVSVTQNGNEPMASYGDSVIFGARVAELHSFNNPGAYDYAAALKRQGITARASSVGEQFAVDSKGGNDWRNTILKLRDRFRDTMKAAMSPEQASIMFGALFGGYDNIPQQVVKNFAATGLVHILSVSGTHIALVAGIVLWFGRVCRLRPVVIAIIASVVILLYSVLAGLTPPVLRSAAMGMLSLAAMALGRERDARTALAVVALVMLALTPGLIYDLSFQLSFAATAGLVLLYPAIGRRFSEILPPWLAGGLAVTLSAQLSVVPILAWYFNSLSISSFAANLILVPAIEIIVVAGLAGILLSFVWTLGASLVLTVCGLAINVVLYLVAVFAAIPMGNIYLPPFSLASSAAYYLLLLWLFGYKPQCIPSVHTLFSRHRRLAAGVLASVLAIGLMYAHWPRPAAVHFIDVGQGDAVLVTTPRGRAVLIDTGGTPGESGFDIGERVVASYLKHYGVLSLDYLILTHGHQDHAGGAAGLAGALPVKHILLSKELPTPATAGIIRVKKGQDIIPAYEGQTIEIDGVSLTIVHAAVENAGGGSKRRGSNESSTVVRVVYGNHSFLITGDLTADEEKHMIQTGLTRSTVLKLAHHGAKSSSTLEFLQAVKPEYAVISAGYNNRYGHPHAETLERLVAQEISYFRTDRQGAVVFRTDGDRLGIETFAR